MLDVQFKVEGAEALKARMKSVGHEISYKGGRFALRKAANLVADKVKENARRLDDPETAEQIAKNVAVRWSPKRFKATGDLMFRVGILGGAAPPKGARVRRRGKDGKTLAELGELVGKGKNNPGGDTWYWRLVEFGTRNTAAHPFLRPALDGNQAEALKVFMKFADKAIDRAIKKAAVKGK